MTTRFDTYLKCTSCDKELKDFAAHKGTKFDTKTIESLYKTYGKELWREYLRADAIKAGYRTKFGKFVLDLLRNPREIPFIMKQTLIETSTWRVAHRILLNKSTTKKEQ